MASRNLHREAFDEHTQEKLAIYKDYLEVFLRVFMNTTRVARIQIFDFFAGPGSDPEGNPGSPLITLSSVRKIRHETPSCQAVFRLYFNEIDPNKYEQLKARLAEEIPDNSLSIQTDCLDFPEAFNSQFPTMDRSANLVFLDQNGCKQVSKEVFGKLAGLQMTDTIFFVASSMANRFRELKEIRQHLPLIDSDFEHMNGANVHRIITAAYKRWIPKGRQYYMGSFSFRKRSNVYGLVFGSSHPCGLDKFLTVAWNHGGDADFDIDDDHLVPDELCLFEEFNKPKKVALFQKALSEKILAGEIRTYEDIYLFSLEFGCLARHSQEGLKKMVSDGTLQRQKFAVSYAAWTKQEKRPILFPEADSR